MSKRAFVADYDQSCLVLRVSQFSTATNQGRGFFGGKDINQAAQAIDQSGLGREIIQGQAGQ
jgi:predicted small secreted protein